jgi:hypothetical protein
VALNTKNQINQIIYFLASDDLNIFLRKITF